MPSSANTVTGGYVRDAEGRLVVSGADSSVATLAAPRLLMDGVGAASTSITPGTEYLLCNGQTDVAIASFVTSNNPRMAPKLVYIGLNYDYGGTTQKLYMDCGVALSNTASSGSVTFNLYPFTVSSGTFTKGTAVLTSAPLAVTAINSFQSLTTSQINKPADGMYMISYVFTNVPALLITVSARLYVVNV